MIDIPPPPPAPPNVYHECVISAAAYYNLPPELIVSVRLHEAGTAGKVTVHANGARDIGPMQINVQHVKFFQNHGISARALVDDECTNIFAGAFMLQREIATARDMWRGIGNYHSRTPKFHWPYRNFISNKLRMLTARYPAYVKWLRAHAGALRATYLANGVLVETSGTPK